MQTTPWQQILRQNFTNIETLADFLELDATQRQHLTARPRFALSLPVRLAGKIAKGDLNDPILKQYLPTNSENTPSTGFVSDPVGDCNAQMASKLLQKYKGRVLLICTSACAMHCRYCFRQNFPYETEDKTFEKELDIIARDTSIHEVILSGGDPLSLPDRVLTPLLRQLNEIPHVTKIRFHTKFPIGIPERIDEEFLALIQSISKQVLFVIHVNHPRELDSDILYKMKLLRQCGAIIMNQSVLLRGVNDDADTLQELCELLVDNGVIPYYLHQLDRVSGTAHFEVPEEEGKRLIDVLTRRLPGYAVPKYVREVPGEPSKCQIK